MAEQLSDWCNKMYPNSMVDRITNTVYAEDLLGGSGLDDNINGGGGGRGGVKTKVALSDNGRIASQKDYRFFLLRHTSLLDSMLYSDYVYTRLQINTKKGEQKFMEMLAKMGLPLDECRQPFCFMKPTLRRRLKEKLNTYAEVRLSLSLSL
jgi:cell division control protein 45